jgi:flagellar L-ring protein FlgH
MIIHTRKLALVLLLTALPDKTTRADSLWVKNATNEHNMFADKLATRVGDILTIVVQESASATNSLNLTTARTSTANQENMLTNLVNQFITALPTSILGNNKATQSMAKNGIPNAPTPGPFSSTNLTSSYNGGGSITNSQVVNSTAAVTVIDVLPNGNMVIEGVRLVRFSKEAQFASLRGVVRKADVQANNTVVSTNIADAQVEFVSEGSLTDAQKQGWLLRLAGHINPI